MAQPLSNGPAYHSSVPESYVFPVHQRPGDSSSCVAAEIPVVDLAGDDQDKIVKQIMDAGKEFGFFHVINHGVPEEVMRDMMSSAEEFFRLPTEDKMVHYSTDNTQLPWFHTSIGNEQEKVLYWRDCLRLGCYPFEQFKDQWPEKPATLRAALEAYTTAVRALAQRLLRLTAAGLGLDEAHFEEGGLTAGPVLMNVNHYVACPEPSLTLGLAPHCDPNIVTILMENGVRGLQTRRHGGWVDVEPLPGALVVNFGHQVEVISNGVLRSVEHRAVTNARAARTTLAFFIRPDMGCTLAPAPELVAAGEAPPPLYRPYTYQEFMGAYLSATGDRDAVLAHFQINHRL